MSLFDISGRSALVVGAGGLGRAIALGLAAHGARVAVADLDGARAAEVVAEVAALVDNPEAAAFSVDVTQETSVAALAERTAEWAPHLDILVNAFGITFRKRAEDLTIGEWRAVMDVNAQGVFACCQAFGRGMIERGGGKIVNLSSVRGRYGAGAQPEYSASKGAVDALTRSLAAQWARFGVYVNAVAPTVIETELTRSLLEDERAVRALRESIPLGRWGIPADIVGPVLFLASPASDFVSGQVLYVDGGLTSRI
ncbi:MAG: SDR family NAD(P)-dependent oxidoreductase [Thermoleophilia bacterium]